MSMTSYTGNTDIIAALGTTPEERGLTDDQFKAKFDEGLKAFVTWFNATHLGEILGFTSWQAWTPTLTWTTATPTGIVTTARYCTIGKTCFFEILISATSGNGATNLTISTPINPKVNSFYPSVMHREAVGPTYTQNPCYVDDTGGNAIKFNSFATATAGQPLNVVCTGFYEIT